MNQNSVLTQVALDSFKQDNSDFSLDTFDFFDKEAVSNLKFGSSAPGDVVPKLKTLQRLYRLTNKEEVARSLMNQGLHSAVQIASIPEHKFVSKFKSLLTSNGVSSEEQARAIHKNATARKTMAMLSYTDLMQKNSAFYKSGKLDNQSVLAAQANDDIPSYETLFGNQDFCDCPDCRSIMSPAAYFVDLMRLKEKFVVENNDPLYHLHTRRPDLWELPLSCENTNTVIPKIEIVNKVLLETIKYGATDEYLTELNYPFNLPFNLPIKRIRKYLDQSKTSLPDIWVKLAIFEEGEKSNSVSLETLGLSVHQWNIFCTPLVADNGTYATPEAEQTLFEYFGLIYDDTNTSSLEDTLKAVDLFLKHTLITHAELNELLFQQLSDLEKVQHKNDEFFINVGKSPSLTLVKNDDSNFELTNLSPSRIDHINRFIRLAKLIGWSFTDLDWALRVIRDIIDPASPLEIDDANQNSYLSYLAWIQHLSTSFDLSVNECCGILGSIKDTGLKSGSTFYSETFESQLVPNADSWRFENESQNSLYTIDPYTGDQQKLNQPLPWKNTSAIAFLKDTLYMVTNDLLYAINPVSGSPTELSAGGSTWDGIQGLVANEITGALYATKYNQLYEVNPKDGGSKLLDDNTIEWSKTYRLVSNSQNRTLYSITDGVLYSIDTANGKPSPLSGPVEGKNWDKVQGFAFMGTEVPVGSLENKLYIINNHVLYLVDPTANTVSQLEVPKVNMKGVVNLCSIGGYLFLFLKSSIYRLEFDNQENILVYEVIRSDEINWQLLDHVACFSKKFDDTELTHYGSIYATNSDRIYAINPEAGNFRALLPNNMKDEYLINWNKIIHPVELNGCTYGFQPNAEGDYELIEYQVEQQQSNDMVSLPDGLESWTKPVAMTAHDGFLYIINEEVLYKADPRSGVPSAIPPDQGDNQWSKTTHLCALLDNLYSITDGELRQIELTGDYVSIKPEGTPENWNWNQTTYLIANNHTSSLLIINKGLMYEVNPVNETFYQLTGGDLNWRRVQGMAINDGGDLFVIVQNELYLINGANTVNRTPDDTTVTTAKLDPQSVDWSNLHALFGSSSVASTLYAIRDQTLYSIAEDGNFTPLTIPWDQTQASVAVNGDIFMVAGGMLYQVTPNGSDTAYKPLMPPNLDGVWSGLSGLTYLSSTGLIYTINSGRLYSILTEAEGTTPAGSWTKITEDTLYADTSAIASLRDKVYTITKGNLYTADLSGSTPEMVLNNALLSDIHLMIGIEQSGFLYGLNKAGELLIIDVANKQVTRPKGTARNWKGISALTQLYGQLYGIVNNSLCALDTTEGKRTFIRPDQNWRLAKSLCGLDETGELYIFEEKLFSAEYQNYDLLSGVISWENTTGLTNIGDDIYAIVDSQFYSVSMVNGYPTKHMPLHVEGTWDGITGMTGLDSTKRVYVINDGRFYSINPANGSSQRPDGGELIWGQSHSLTKLGDTLYCIKDGKPTAVDPATANPTELTASGDAFPEITSPDKFQWIGLQSANLEIASATNALFAIYDGVFYKIEVTTGTYSLSYPDNKRAAWANTTAIACSDLLKPTDATIVLDKIYTVTDNVFYEVDPNTGSRVRLLGAKSWNQTTHMVAVTSAADQASGVKIFATQLLNKEPRTWSVPDINQTALPTQQNANIQNALAAALKLSHEDLVSLGEAFINPEKATNVDNRDILLTTSNLSILYRLSLLTKFTGLSISDCIDAEILLSGSDTQWLNSMVGSSTKDFLEVLNKLINFSNWLNTTKLSVDELQFIYSGSTSNAKIQNEALGDDAINNFLKDFKNAIAPTLLERNKFNASILDLLQAQFSKELFSQLSGSYIGSDIKAKDYQIVKSSLTSGVLKPILKKLLPYLPKTIDPTDPKNKTVQIDKVTDAVLSQLQEGSRVFEKSFLTQPNNLFKSDAPLIDLYQILLDKGSEFVNSEKAISKPFKESDLEGIFKFLTVSTNENNGDKSPSEPTIAKQVADALNLIYTLQHKTMVQHLASLFKVDPKLIPVLDVLGGLTIGDFTYQDKNVELSSGKSYLISKLLMPADMLGGVQDKNPLYSQLQVMQRYAMLLNTLSYSPKEALTLITNPEIFNISYSTDKSSDAQNEASSPSFQFTHANVRSMVKYKSLVDQFADKGNRLLNFFLTNKDWQSDTQTIQKLHSITGWKASYIQYLWTQILPETKLKSGNASGIAPVDQVFWLKECFEVIHILGIEAKSVKHIINLTSDSPLYDEFKTFADALWGGLCKVYKDNIDVTDKIRKNLDGQLRDALLDRTMFQIRQTIPDILSPDDLYEYLLIDVQVTGAVPTSYVKEAISATQLYIYRCMNNLENKGVEQIQTDLNAWWPWLQHYRVWQANREVFLYPENYIEPELRKNKTDLFATLESTLQQSKLDEASVTSAVHTYIDGFAEVANLEVVGGYQFISDQISTVASEPQQTLYLIGRSRKKPYEYFYRNAIFDYNSGSYSYEATQWSSWVKIDLKINSAYVSPVFAFNRLYVFWGEVKQGKKKSGSTTMQPDSDGKSQTVTTAPSTYTIEFFYSFYDFNKKWIPAQPLGVPITDIDLTEDSKNTLLDGGLAVNAVYDPNSKVIYWNTNNSNAGSPQFGALTELEEYLGTSDEYKGLWKNLIKPDDKPILIVGDPKTANIQGDVYLYDFDGAWTQKSSLAIDPAYLKSGTSVASWGEWMFVGSDFEDVSVFRLVSGIWTFRHPLDGIENGVDAVAGPFVSMWENRAVVGYVYANGSYLITYGLQGEKWAQENSFDLSAIGSTPSVESVAIWGDQIFAMISGTLYYSIMLPTGQWTALQPVEDDKKLNITSSKGGKGVVSVWQNTVVHYFLGEDNLNLWEYYVGQYSPGKVTKIAKDPNASVDFGSSLTIWNNHLFVGDPGVSKVNHYKYKSPGWGSPKALDVPHGSSGAFGTSVSIWGANVLTTHQANLQLALLNTININYYQISGLVRPWYIIKEDNSGTQFLNIPGQNQHYIRLNNVIVPKLSQILFNGGIEALLNLSTQEISEPNSPDNAPTPTLDFDSANGLYYWELFFHMPFLVAKNLTTQQQFERAQAWYKYIFNPTITQSENTDGAVGNNQYWRFLKLRVNDANSTDQPSNADQIASDLTNASQLAEYHDDPFDPHVIASLRPVAYQKAVVMHYINNLIGWGDNLFSQYSIETIIEATMLYVEASDLLGKKPVSLGECKLPKPQTINQMSTAMGDALQDFPEFLLDLEQKLPSSLSSKGKDTPNNYIPNIYFGIPENDQFTGYWDTIQTRLFDIRHGLNIKGIKQDLALFQPPINPMQLVAAVASGEGLSQALAQSNMPIPNYRFTVIIEKAKSITQSVIQLGQSILTVLEKSDAEQLSRLLNTNQHQLLTLANATKQDELQAANQNLSAIQAGQKTTQDRLNHYSGLISGGYSSGEHAQIDMEGTAIGIQTAAQAIKIAAVPAYLIPTIFGFSDGGLQPGDSVMVGPGIMEGTAQALSQGAGLAGTVAGYDRRSDDWKFQQSMAQDDLDQIAIHIEAAQTQISIVQKEITQLQKQISQEQAVGDFLKNKFTRQELYQWMTGRIATLYFQAYQLANAWALEAQQAWQFELCQQPTFVQPDNWNDLYHGLTSGETLYQSLQQMEKAYLDQNTRRFEITKFVSLKNLQSTSNKVLEDLKSGYKCSFELSQKVFDNDFPGHYCRQIKSVSVSFPMLLAPYQTVNATLTQTGSKTLTQANTKDIQYLMSPKNAATSALRFDPRASQQVALTQGVNDNGMFELNFNDERYLPFEGTGAVSSWTLEISQSKDNKIDLSSLTDVILTIRYTSKYGGDSFKEAVTKLYE